MVYVVKSYGNYLAASKSTTTFVSEESQLTCFHDSSWSLVYVLWYESI